MGAGPSPLPAPDGKTTSVVPQEPVTASQNVPGALSPELQQILSDLPQKDATGLLSMFVSRSITNTGPDPETARVMAEAEMHQEECKLKAFRANLEVREKQNGLDHEFRKKKLNHATAMNAVVIGVTVCGVAGGLFMTASGNTSLGTPILVASFTMLSTIAGKMLSSRDKD